MKADSPHLIILFSLLSDMLSNGPMRGSMQQAWGPQGHIGGSGGPLMGQGIGPGRLLPSMNAALATRALPGSRGMVNMQMMGSGEEVRTQPLLTIEPFLTFHIFLLLLLLRNGAGKPSLPSATWSAQSDCTMAGPNANHGSLWRPKQVSFLYDPKWENWESGLRR